MPRRRLNSYLRTYRLKAALSQSELGELLDIGSTAICNYEAESRPISAKTLIASEIIFGVPAATLFPQLFDDIEEELALRALKMAERLQYRKDSSSRKKLKLFLGIPSRLRSATKL
jgi:transcriptional regulator with XRE-family HTH domain